MATKQLYEDELSREDPEYLLKVAISSVLNRPLPAIMNEEAASWAELAHPPINVSHQEETTEATGTKRKSDSPVAEDAPKPKTHRRKGDPEPDYSGMTREVLKNNRRRTGQACDRCKLRKLRCDPTPNSCMQCLSAEQPCRSTDRVTGETFLRGEASALKAENEYLKGRVSNLEDCAKQLQEENEQLSAKLSFYQGFFQVPNDTLR